MTQRCSRLLAPATLAVFVLIGAGAGFAAEQPLPPDEAFKFKASFKRPDTVVAEIVPAKNHYFYKSKTRFALKNASGVLIRQVSLPAGEMKNDPFFGPIEVYKAPIAVTIDLDRAPKAQSFTLIATYQGCNEKLSAIVWGREFLPIKHLVARDAEQLSCLRDLAGRLG